MLAVIKAGGKQYIVSPGQKINIEKLDQKEGEQVVFDEVLLVENEGEVQVGKPLVNGVKVTGTVLKQGKLDKVIIFKFKAKKREKTKRGHRQPYTQVEIKEISN